MAVFVDTGAWFAYFVRRDPDHRAATAWMRRNRQPLVTTDDILDERLTLLKMRENYRLAVAAGEALWQQRVARMSVQSGSETVCNPLCIASMPAREWFRIASSPPARDRGYAENQLMDFCLFFLLPHVSSRKFRDCDAKEASI